MKIEESSIYPKDSPKVISKPVDHNGLFYGPQVMSLIVMGCHHQIIVDYNHKKELRFWDGTEDGWVDSEFKAKMWNLPASPKDIPYAENNCYQCWMHYSIGPYSVALTHSISLYPCGISVKIGNRSLYLTDYFRTKPWGNPFAKPTQLVTQWSSRMDEAMKFYGIDQLREAFFQIVIEANV